MVTAIVVWGLHGRKKYVGFSFTKSSTCLTHWFVKDFKEKRLKIKLKYEHKISHVSYVRAHPKEEEAEAEAEGEEEPPKKKKKKKVKTEEEEA